MKSYTANDLNQLKHVGTQERLFDEDGNITDNGTHLYIWDAENRLIEIKKKSDNSTVATYAYDYQSRRITKTVGGVETNFVYDDWNPIAEFSGTTLDKSYTWGMDLSGSMQGAGGVGGLLSVNDGSDTYYPTFDGNGNVSEYVDSTGTPVAHYEYDAFGQVVASGSKKDDFTHQFSTKPLDTESGLHYYGYRYYDSANGRWVGRDPIQERGGLNLYGFVGNDSLSLFDILGLDEVTAVYVHSFKNIEVDLVYNHVGGALDLGEWEVEAPETIWDLDDNLVFQPEEIETDMVEFDLKKLSKKNALKQLFELNNLLRFWNVSLSMELKVKFSFKYKYCTEESQWEWSSDSMTHSTTLKLEMFNNGNVGHVSGAEGVIKKLMTDDMNVGAFLHETATKAAKNKLNEE